MKKKQQSFIKFGKAYYKDSGYLITVYGELEEDYTIEGIKIIPVKYGAKSNEVISSKKKNENGKVLNVNDASVHDSEGIIIPCNGQKKARVRRFNMGFSIYNQKEETQPWNEETAIELAKKRFSKSPLTSQNTRFLNPNMAEAFVENELKYIEGHIEKFLPKDEPKKEPKKKKKPEHKKGKLAPLEHSKNYSKPTDRVQPVGKVEVDEVPNEFPQNDTKPSFKTLIGKWLIFDRDKKQCIGVIKDIIQDNPKCVRAVLYWGLVPSNEGWGLDFDVTVKDSDTASLASEKEINFAQDILGKQFHRRWDEGDKTFYLIID